MKVATLAAVVAGALCGAHAGTSVGSSDVEARDNVKGFEYQVREIKGKTRNRMTGVSWRPGCPVHIDDLRLIRTTFWDFDGKRETGSIVVHEDEVGRDRSRLPEPLSPQVQDPPDAADRPLRRLGPRLDECRQHLRLQLPLRRTAPRRWSQHAYGRAIDLNPIENPYVTPSGHVSPPAGQPYADRSRHDKGMVHRGDDAYRAFAQEDWKWGGDWSGTKDYQHFSRNGS